MPETGFSYPEEVLHWIWKELLFCRDGLKTNCGKTIQISDAGTANPSDGPDFTRAKLIIGNMEWNGSVEIHTASSDWYKHRHHTDPNYNNVILHVVADHAAINVVCENKSRPFTLNILPYLAKNLHEHVKAHYQNDTLPRIGNLHYLSEDAVVHLIDKAHQEYLEKKINDFYGFYDANEIPSTAWKKALIKSVFDGFGISQNRQAMQKLADIILSDGKLINNNAHKNEFIDYVLAAAFAPKNNILWKHKSSRPANHPKNRVKQAALFCHEINNTPFKSFLQIDALKLWKNWCKTLNIKNEGRIKILYGTVFIPAIGVIAQLFAHQKLNALVLDAWNNLRCPIPSSIIKPLHNIGLKETDYKYKLGSVHFLNTYCK